MIAQKKDSDRHGDLNRIVLLLGLSCFFINIICFIFFTNLYLNIIIFILFYFTLTVFIWRKNKLSSHSNKYENKQVNTLNQDLSWEYYMLDALTEPVISVDTDAFISHANKAAKVLFNLSDRPEKMSLTEAIRSPELHDAYQSFLKDRELLWQELTINLAPLRSLRTRMSFSKDKKQAIFTFVDISHSVHTAEVQRDFLAKLSHELKTPITIMSANLELLELSELGFHGPKKNLFDALKRQSTIINQIVEQLLLDARFLNSSLMPEMTAINLEDFALDFKKSLGTIGSNIESTIPKDLIIESDRKLLERVFGIFFENSRKYAGAQCRFKIIAHREKSSVAIELSDDGPGILEHYKERIFEKYFREPRYQSSAISGLGLGLYQARQLLSAMGASVILLDKKPGACFEIRLKAFISC
jgi:two-component system phosphate regulon sensor histidine kinase PhoR